MIAEYEKEGVPLVITPGTDGLWFSPGSTLNDKIHDCNYELSNHLGNVMVTLSEEILFDNGTRTTYLQSYTDYYPFGGRMSSREFNIDSYRYGFNGKENDNEVNGEGNQQDYGMRIYDPRVGRFLSVDPLAGAFVGWSPYPFAMNSPIEGIDIDGMEYLSSEVAHYEFKSGLVLVKPQYMDIINPGWHDKVSTFYIGNTQYMGYNNVKAAFTISIPDMKEYFNFDPGLDYGTNIDPLRDWQKSTSTRPSSSFRTKNDGQMDNRFTMWDNIVSRSPTPPAIGIPSRALLVYYAYDLYKTGVNSIRGLNYSLEDEGQNNILEMVRKDVQIALQKSIIPEKYQNVKDISSIMNILLQGENNSQKKNKELEQISLKIGATISVPRLAEPASDSPIGPVGQNSPLFDFKKTGKEQYIWIK